jgi:hypothetical protein
MGVEPQVSRTIADFAEGTPAKIAFDEIATKLSGNPDPQTSRPYYNGTSYAECSGKPGGIVRNPECWGADWDLSGVPVTHLFGGFFGGGAMVTARHLCCSNHYSPVDKRGTVLRFVGNNGDIITRTVIEQSTGSDVAGNIGNPTLPVGDVCLYLLDSPVPETVAVYPIVGPWRFEKTLLSSSGGISDWWFDRSMAFVVTDQFRNVEITVIGNPVTSFTTYSVPYTEVATPPLDFSYEVTADEVGTFLYISGSYPPKDYGDFVAYPITGDSGSPAFIPLPNDQLALGCVLTLPNGGTLLHKPMLDEMIAEVDARAISRGVLASPTGLTVTVAPDPTV